jgi:hypothetical protein
MAYPLSPSGRGEARAIKEISVDRSFGLHSVATSRATFGIEVSRLYSTEEAAQILGISRKTLQNWRWAGSSLPYLVIGRRTVRYLGSSLIELIERGRRLNTSQQI